MQELEAARTRLVAKGYKWTGPRREIIVALLDNRDHHFSAEELYGMLQKNNSEIGLATVYRTLDILAESGIVHKMQFGDGCSRFELADDDHHHHHLVCTSCNTVFEVTMDLLEKLEKKIEEEHDFAISGHHLKFFGTCSGCRNKGENQ